MCLDMGMVEIAKQYENDRYSVKKIITKMIQVKTLNDPFQQFIIFY